MIKDKLTSQLICVFIYIVSFYLSYIFTPQSIGSIWLKILIWHLYATLFIYLGSVILNNSSLYDPFWSVAPVPIVIYLAVNSNNSITLDLLVLFPIIFWAGRLTRNWIISWRGFEHEDFRYIDLKNTNRINAEFRNFFGIHLFPTLIVNFCLYPLIFIFSNNVIVTPFLYLASLFTLLSVVLETVADEQMREFRKNPLNKGKTMKYKSVSYTHLRAHET